MSEVGPSLDFLRRQNQRFQQELRGAQRERLKTGGGGGTYDGMDAVDAKVAAAEARTDTKFAELRGDLGKFATTGAVWAAAGTAIATILGVLLAVMAFGGDRFDAGMSAGGAVAPIVEQQKARDAAQDEKLDEILRRLPQPVSTKSARP